MGWQAVDKGTMYATGTREASTCTNPTGTFHSRKRKSAASHAQSRTASARRLGVASTQCIT